MINRVPQLNISQLENSVNSHFEKHFKLDLPSQPNPNPIQSVIDRRNLRYISSVLDLFAIPNFYIRKGRPHGHRYGKKAGCKEYHTAKQLQKRCRKKKYENIHDRFIRDKFFRKTMIELGRSEEIILEMDRLASEDHSHIATQEEIDVYRGNWWIRSNVVNFDTMPTRRQHDFKKALSTLHRLKKAEDKTHYENWSQSSSSWWQWKTT